MCEENVLITKEYRLHELELHGVMSGTGKNRDSTTGPTYCRRIPRERLLTDTEKE